MSPSRRWQKTILEVISVYLTSLLLSASLFATDPKLQPIGQNQRSLPKLYPGAISNNNNQKNDPCAQHMNIPAICCLNKTGPFVIADFLYWNSRFTNATVTSKATHVGSNGISNKFNDKQMDFDWNPGCKVGIGAVIKHDDWSPLILWTFMNSSPDASWHSSSSDNLAALSVHTLQNAEFLLLDPLVLAKNVKAKWNLNFNSIDLEMGKNFFVSPSFSMRPFGCLKLGSVFSKLRVSYSNLVDTIGKPWPGTQTFTRSNQAWLIGPRVGGTSFFRIYQDFGFVANVATSLLAVIDKPKVTSRISSTLGLVPAGTPVGFKEKTPETFVTPEFDLYLGFDWGHCFNKKTLVNFSAGYEFQFYAQVISAFQSLAMNGLTLSALIAF